MIKNKHELFTHLATGATLITPNNRLSQHLLHEFTHSFSEPVIAKPACYAYQAFLQCLFQELCHSTPTESHPVILTPWQQRLIWQEIIQNSTYSPQDGLLNAVEEAWQRCQEWLVEYTHPAFALTPQTQQFQCWAQHYQQRLHHLGLVAHEQLASYLIHKITGLTQRTLIWVCFDDFTPLQRALQEALTQAGFTHIIYDIPPKESQRYHHAASDKETEYRDLISWLNERLSLGDKRIGVVIPDLATNQTALQRLLEHHLAPEHFDISMGESLTTFPIVAHALEWLALDNNTLTVQQARLLLHSPFVAGSRTEFLARADLLHRSSALQNWQLTLSQFTQTCAKDAPILANALTSMTPYPATASPSEWVTLFKQRLQHIGFPGEEGLTSYAYQALHRWLALLEEFLQFTVITSNLDQATALNLIRTGTAQTIFQIQKPPAPIRVLGLLEASGCEFDALWMCGVTDQCLPQKTRFSAFIPISLQRETHMPHTSPEREWHLAMQILDRLQHNSQISIFSFAHLFGDTPQLPSPLIQTLPSWHHVNIPNTLHFNAWPHGEEKHLISLDESYQLPISQNELLGGGTSLLANQAKCPFRAFAAHRLHATTQVDTTVGLAATERGQIIHRVLELFWRELNSQKQLIQLSTTSLDKLIHHVIHTALREIASQRSLIFNPLIQEIEQTRLTQLLQACLAWERLRPPFIVEAIETTYTLHLSGLNLQVRVDRLDRLVDSDDKWVLDYKTTLPTQQPWYEERPEAPQLLLYSLLDEKINTLIFMQLKAGQLTCQGLSAVPQSLTGIATLKSDQTWPNLRQQWQNDLTILATEIHTGFCAPQPNKASTCIWCEFKALCRL